MQIDDTVLKLFSMACGSPDTDLAALTSAALLPHTARLLGAPVVCSREVPLSEILARAGQLMEGGTLSFPVFLKAWASLDRAFVVPQAPVEDSEQEEQENRQALLDAVSGTVMNELALQYPPLHGRDGLLQRLVSSICRKERCCSILLGDAGTGKTALVRGLVRRVMQGCYPALQDHLFIEVNPAEFRQQLLKNDLADRLQPGQRIVFFIDEFHALNEGSNLKGNDYTALDLLKPAMADGRICLIGATTNQEFHGLETDPALLRRLNKITVNPLETAEVRRVLLDRIPGYEGYHRCRVQQADRVIDFLLEAGPRFLPERMDPDRSLDLIDQCLAAKASGRKGLVVREGELARQMVRARLAGKAAAGDRIARQLERTGQRRSPAVVRVTLEDFQQTVAAAGNVPLELVRSNPAERIMTLEKTLRRNIVGQERAVTAFVHAIRRMKLNLHDRDKPLSFMFAGPTGCGKTHLALTAAGVLFGDRKESCHRFDMSEFAEKHKISSLIGSAPGYVDSWREGRLTGIVKKNPHCILVFDEIEKAHAHVCNLLLQVLDAGRLTDGMGQTVDFRHTLVVFTSNAGMQEVLERGPVVGFMAGTGGPLQMEQELRPHFRKYFTPEFINRIDHWLVFEPFSTEEVKAVIKMEVRKVLQRLNIRTAVGRTVHERILREYYDPAYGARSIKRGVEACIVDVLAEKMLSGKRPVRAREGY